MVISAERLHQIADHLADEVERRRTNRLGYFVPSPKQQEFLDRGAFLRERLFLAGNQLGKSEVGAYETALHLTGLYPPDWIGHRFRRPINAWASCETGVLAREVAQRKLCGTPGSPEDFGSGLIPRHLFIGKPSLSRGVTDAFDTIWVRHVTGGISSLAFKSYEQGRPKFQGATLDWIWLDEEPPQEIYTECLARVTATNGLVILTFTPLLGPSAVVLRFLEGGNKLRGYVQMAIKDATHLTPEMVKALLNQYPAHERDARLNGVPMLGSGKVFDINVANITEPSIPFEHVPHHWAKLWGVDFGIGHPFAAVLIAWDRDRDCIHVLHTMRMSDLQPIHHAAAIRAVAGEVPVAWPRDALQRQKDSGQQLIQSYRNQGLLTLPSHAAFPDGGDSVERGLMEIYERASTGRFKVGESCADWFHEWQIYHRKDGMIVKTNDDILDAGRYALMMRRSARAVALGPTRWQPGQARRRRPGEPLMAKGIDFDLTAV